MLVWPSERHCLVPNQSLHRLDRSQNLLGQSASQSYTCHNMVNLILVAIELNVDEYGDHNGCMKSSETASSETWLCSDCHKVEWTFMSIERKKEYCVNLTSNDGRGSLIGSVSAWHASGPGIDPHVRHIFSWRLGHEKILTASLPLPLIQEEQLSVTGERMCTKYW